MRQSRRGRAVRGARPAPRRDATGARRARTRRDVRAPDPAGRTEVRVVSRHPALWQAARMDDRQRYDAATATLQPPFAIVDLAAFRRNAAGLTRRAAGKPIRVASKSVRCRALLTEVLRIPGFSGIMAFTLPEALWLARTNTSDDILVAYPTTDTATLAQLAAEPAVARAITVMVDTAEHLDIIEKAMAGTPDPQPVRVCIDLDTGFRALRGLLRAGARRSPVRTPVQAAELARNIAGRVSVTLAGLMAYEA